MVTTRAQRAKRRRDIKTHRTLLCIMSAMLAIIAATGALPGILVALYLIGMGIYIAFDTGTDQQPQETARWMPNDQIKTVGGNAIKGAVYTCSNCGEATLFARPYCQHCGRKMLNAGREANEQ